MKEFVTFEKNFGGRKMERYFHKLENAKRVMIDDFQNTIKALNGKVEEERELYDKELSCNVFFKRASFPNGEECMWALIDSYFEDEED